MFVGPHVDSHGGVAAAIRLLSFGCRSQSDGRTLQLEVFPSTVDGSKSRRLFYAIRRVVKFCITSRTAAWGIHAHAGAHGAFWRKAAYGWITALRGGKVIYQIHPSAFWDYYNDGGVVRRAIIRSTLRKADALIAITREMYERLEAIAPGVPRYLLPNPVDLSTVPQPVSRDAATVAYVGWLVRNKGVFELVDAVAAMRASRESLRLVFAGSKDDGALRSYVRERGLQDVTTFTGWLTPAGVLELLTRTTLLALPSYTEGLPMTVLEALACGTPIVTTPVGGIPEILVDRRNALFVPPRDVRALAHAIEELLDDPRKREAMSEANRTEALKFDLHYVAARLTSIYDDVMANT